MENAGPGSRSTGYGVPGWGKHGVWKRRGVENTGCGKHGVWKTQGMENTGCGKHGVWKTQGVENTGSRGKHGVWWEQRGLVENTGSQWKTRSLSAKQRGTIISPNNEVEILLFQIAMKIYRRKTRFLVKNELNIS